jgi:hypothetical protein
MKRQEGSGLKLYLSRLLDMRGRRDVSVGDPVNSGLMAKLLSGKITEAGRSSALD